MVSRSFGSTVTEFDDLAESVSYFATKAAEKLRSDGSVAASVCVYIRTNPFKEDEPQYQRSMVVPLCQPSDDTMALISAALKGLKKIYRSGYRYKKTGVLLMGLQNRGTVQAMLFDDAAKQGKSTNMMSVMDTINRKMGQGSMTIAASGIVTAGQCVGVECRRTTPQIGMSCRRLGSVEMMIVAFVFEEDYERPVYRREIVTLSFRSVLIDSMVQVKPFVSRPGSNSVL
jgi:hypothetical protein